MSLQDCSLFCSRAVNCSNAGTCTSSGTCQCDKGYYGDTCQYKACPACVHGTCNNATGGCECEQNYYDATCSTYCAANETCSSHGTCDSVGACACDVNYYTKVFMSTDSAGVMVNALISQNCSTYCDANVTCSSHGTCSNLGDCNCSANYYGTVRQVALIYRC